MSMGSQVGEKLAKKVETKLKKAPFAGKKTTALTVNQLSTYPYQKKPFSITTTAIDKLAYSG